MTASTIKRLPKNTIELTLTIPAADVKKAYDRIVDEAVKTVEIKGFRKGKAPRKKVEEQLDKKQVNQELLQQLLPQAYSQAVQDHKLNPIVHPRINVATLEEGKDLPAGRQGWQFVATTCEKPDIDLNNYKDKVKQITAKSKIVVPGKEQQAPSLEEIINAVLSSATVELPDFVVEQEVDRLLAHTLSEIKTLGLTLDQYLSSTGKNPQTLRDEAKIKAQRDIKLEFILEEIAKLEKIVVTDQDLNQALKAAKSDEERQNLEQNKYLLANILRRQKTLDFVKNL